MPLQGPTDLARPLLEQADGNPLALVELPVLLGTAELGGRWSLPVPLPLTEQLERAFASRVAELPTPTRTLLLLAAADDDSVLGEILAAAAMVSVGEPSVESLVPAVDPRLIEIDGARLVFRHPPVHSAVYQQASIAERQAAHAAWAEVLVDQPDRHAWHRPPRSSRPTRMLLRSSQRQPRERGVAGLSA